jgi:hypothetical protein
MRLKILSFFSSKYTHPDPQIRRKAVSKMKDIPQLIEILKKDPDPNVRNVAHERIYELRKSRKK